MIRLILFLSVLLLIGCKTSPQAEITPSPQSVTTQQPNTPIEEGLVGHKNNVWTVSWSPDGSMIASGSQDGVIILWNAQTGEQLYSLHGHSGTISSLAWFQNSKTLVSRAADGKVFLWNLDTGEPSKILAGEGVALAPDETILATWLQGTEPPYNDTITLFNVETGEEFCHLGAGWDRPVLRATWSPDSTKLASNILLNGGSDIWDAHACEYVSHEELGDEAIDSLAWSPDGSTLAAGTYAGPYIGLVYLWDIQTKELIHTMQGHPGSVINVSWSPDSKTLATSGFKGGIPSTHVEAVRLWDVETGKLIAVFK